MVGHLACDLRKHLEAVVADRAAARQRAGTHGPEPVEVPEGVPLAPDLAARVGAFSRAVMALADATAQRARDWCDLADLFAAGLTAAIRGRAAALHAEHCGLVRRELDLLDQARALLGLLADSAAVARREADAEVAARRGG